MRLTTVRIRITLWNVAVLALVLGLFLVMVHIAVRSFLLITIDHRLARFAMSIRQIEARLDWNVRAQPRNWPFSTPLLPDNLRRNEVRLIRIFDLQGRSITQFGVPTAPQVSPWDQHAFNRALIGHEWRSSVQEEERLLRVFTEPLHRNGAIIGVLQVAYPLTEMQFLLKSLSLILLALIPFALLLAGIGGLVMTDRALLPLRALTRAAAALGADDLSRRLPVSGDDEFAQLAITFNRLLSHLEGSFTQLEKAIEQERRFTADASHELRTPLTTIKANTSLALRGERTQQQYREALLAADRAADLMNRLVKDLLLLARSDSGQLLLDPQCIFVTTLCQEAASLAVKGDEQTHLLIDVPDPSLMIRGDAHHLTRLLVNLLDNAFAHTPKDGQVTLTASRQDESVAFIITDTGEGISPEHIPHLTERFYRVDASRTRAHGGTGLGLAICQSIVTAHHGTMTINATPAVGTSVTILLPADCVADNTNILDVNSTGA